MQFEFRLARSLSRTRAELLDTMSHEEYIYHRLLQDIDPLPDPIYLNALNCQTIANVNRGQKQKPYDIKLWMPTKKKVQSEDQLKANMRRLIAKP